MSAGEKDEVRYSVSILWEGEDGLRSSLALLPWEIMDQLTGEKCSRLAVFLGLDSAVTWQSPATPNALTEVS